MSLSLAIALNVIADIALIAGLAYVMSRATKLTPHVSAQSLTPSPAEGPKATQPQARRDDATERARGRRLGTHHQGRTSVSLLPTRS